MIVWIDGARGIGKTVAAHLLCEKLRDKGINCTIIDPDELNPPEEVSKDQILRGIMLQIHHMGFIQFLRDTINSNNQTDIIIVPVTLDAEICEKELLHFYDEMGVLQRHILLLAEENTVKGRIKRDGGCSVNARKTFLKDSILFYQNHYLEVSRIDTENKTKEQVVEEIGNELSILL